MEPESSTAVATQSQKKNEVLHVWMLSWRPEDEAVYVC